MKKTAVIYWSGTGNTKQMAEAVLEGMKSAGAEAALLEAAQVDASTFSSVDAVAFGCPAMGSEVLEEMEFEPMFSACKSHLSGKKVALFGSYGWGDGEWGEISVDFENGTAEIIRLADWDTIKTNWFANEAIRYILSLSPDALKKYMLVPLEPPLIS